MKKCLIYFKRIVLFSITLFFCVIGPVNAQTLIAVDDNYEAPVGGTLVIEDPGVLDNATY